MKTRQCFLGSGPAEVWGEFCFLLFTLPTGSQVGPDGSTSHVASAAGSPPGAAAAVAWEQLPAFGRGGRRPQCDDAYLLLSAEGGEADAAVDHLSSPATPRPPPLPSPTVPPTARVLSP